MKTINLLTSVVFVTFSFISFAQNTNNVKRVSFDDFYLHFGPSFERIQKGSLEDFNTMAPNSELLKNEFDSFSQSQGHSISGNAALSVMVGLKFSNKDKKDYRSNPILRLGFSYSSSDHISNSYWKENRFPYDTLTSSQTGQQTFIDSVQMESYNMDYTSEQLRFNAALIFRTNPEARWSLYSGVGATVGVSINSKTRVHYHSHFIDETFDHNFNYPQIQNNNNEERISEEYKNQMNYGFSAYVPFGVDLRLGNKKEFWKRTHLFYELKPEINMVTIPELYTTTNTRVTHGLGVRVTFR